MIKTGKWFNCTYCGKSLYRYPSQIKPGRRYSCGKTCPAYGIVNVAGTHDFARQVITSKIQSGDLIRETNCSECGDTGTDKHPIHAHHDDYRKPLAIRWLCKSCHDDHHRAERRELGKKSLYSTATKCTVPECEKTGGKRNAIIRGLCGTHYSRWYKHGELEEYVLPARGPGAAKRTRESPPKSPNRAPNAPNPTIDRKIHAKTPPNRHRNDDGQIRQCPQTPNPDHPE